MRSFGADGVTLQDRDYEILLGLFECRVMTLSHIAELYFDGKTEAAKKRVQKLKGGGYLRERARRIGDPSVLHIGKKAFLALQEAGKLEGFPSMSVAMFEKRAQVSPLTLRHELEVMDVRTAFFRSVKEKPHLSITEFSTWPALYQFTARHTSAEKGRRELVVKPDGFIRIREKTTEGTFEHMFFLEVDRSTESLEIIAQKAACYLEFYQSGGMAERFGVERDRFSEFPFRVLLICKSIQRKNNVATRFLRNEPPLLTQVWMAIITDAISSPLNSLWSTAKDYGAPTSSARRGKSLFTP